MRSLPLLSRDPFRAVPAVGSVAVSVALFIAVLAGCADDSADGPGGLSGPAKIGFELARDNGCFACHGDGGRGDAPAGAWVGLAGSTLQLADGSSTVADSEFLVAAILDPERDVQAGATLLMPANALTEQQAADIVAYIEALG